MDFMTARQSVETCEKLIKKLIKILKKEMKPKL